jgi:hypothetical protein
MTCIGKACSVGVRLLLTLNNFVCWSSFLTVVAGMANSVAQICFTSSFFKDCALHVQAQAPLALRVFVPLLDGRSVLIAAIIHCVAVSLACAAIKPVGRHALTRENQSRLTKLNQYLGNPPQFFNQLFVRTHPFCLLDAWIKGHRIPDARHYTV